MKNLRLEEKDVASLTKKFGPHFLVWLEEYEGNANFYILWQALGGGTRQAQDGRWGALLLAGYAYLKGRADTLNEIRTEMKTYEKDKDNKTQEGDEAAETLRRSETIRRS